MKNLEIAEIFFKMAHLLEMDEPSFRSRAYERAGRVIDSLSEDLAQIYAQKGLKGLEEIPGVGQAIALKIEEYLKKGQIKDYLRLKKECPVKLEELIQVEGLGPRRIKLLYQRLGVKDLVSLEKAAQKNQISQLEGFGPVSQKNILEGIAFVKKTKNRFLLGEILPLVKELISRLEQRPEVEKIRVAGSVRRMKETIGDVDLLVVSKKPAKVMDFFVNQPGVVKVWARGDTKSSVRFKKGFDCDLRVVRKESFGAAWQYFTGNRFHNILTRRLAIKKGLKLNEYGLFQAKKQIAGSTEAEVYKAIGLKYIPPELRENRGELEAALNDQLPNLIDYGDLKGNCHVHSDWSDGQNSLAELSQVAQQKGYDYLLICDHTQGLKIAGGLTEKELLAQGRQIDKLNQTFKNFKILKGCEVNILADGRLDIAAEVLSQLDVVIASIHSGFKSTSAQMTQRIIKAIENPQVDIIGHPTGRVIFKREAYPVNLDKIFEVAYQTKTALEINSHFSRLDLNEVNIRKAIERGVKLVISTDAHRKEELDFDQYGLALARRGWAEKKDILNTRALNQFLAYFKKDE